MGFADFCESDPKIETEYLAWGANELHSCPPGPLRAQQGAQSNGRQRNVSGTLANQVSVGRKAYRLREHGGM